MNTKLKIEKNKYGLRVYCSTCKKQFNYHNTMCNHTDRQTYKSIVYNNDGLTKVKHHSTRDYDDAIIMAIQFKKDVKNGVLDANGPQFDDDPKSISVISAANMYLNFKHGIDVPTHLKKNISIDHLKYIVATLKQFINILRDNDISVERMPISQLNENHVGYWYDFIRSNYAKGSWNSPLKVLRPWIKHMIEREKVLMSNPFMDVQLVESENTVEAITKEEFNAVCNAVNNASPYEYLGGKNKERKNHYRPYLVEAFKLALYTGLRHEEFVSLTWNDIYEVNTKEEFMIITDNLKVERITGKKYKKKYVPVNEDLKEFLNQQGWQELKGKNKYIIVPFRKVKTRTIMNACSKSFSHYFKQAFPDRKHKRLKCLRKTYLSYLNKEVGDDVVHFSSHSGVKVLEKHYFDKKLIAKGLEVRIFAD